MESTEGTHLYHQSPRNPLKRASPKERSQAKPRSQQGTKHLEISKPRKLRPSEIKRPLLEAERLRLRTAVNSSCTPFIHELNSPELNLVRGYVYINTQLSLHDTFFGFIPERIGSDEAVDSAANALIHLFADKKDYTSQILCTRKYASAISTLRNSMLSASWRQSDAALLAIFLLAFYEHKLRYDCRAFSEAHRKGMCAVLVAQASSRTNRDTELLRSLLYQAWNSSFRTPCIQGISSPFDLSDLLDLDPPSQFKLPLELAGLRKISNQLIIRLPALIASLRRLRQTLHCGRGDGSAEVCAKAVDLLYLRDEAGENAVLHRVKIMKSSSQSPLAQTSFNFEQPSEFKTAVYYWGARILICRICLTLLRLGLPIEDSSCTDELLRAENETSASNMMMAWDYGQAYGAILGRTILVPGYTFVWGVLNDYDTFRNMPSANVRSWLLEKIHGFEAGMSLHVAEEDLGDAAEALIGGPIAGLHNPAFDSFFGI
jgi:hypothetical protein